MSEIDTEAIRARVDAATEGPWWAWDRGVGWCVAIGEPDADGMPARLLPDAMRTDIGLAADAEFIAHARQDVPALLEEVAKLRAENAKLRDRDELTEKVIGIVERSLNEVSAKRAEAERERDELKAAIARALTVCERIEDESGVFRGQHAIDLSAVRTELTANSAVTGRGLADHPAYADIDVAMTAGVIQLIGDGKHHVADLRGDKAEILRDMLDGMIGERAKLDAPAKPASDLERAGDGASLVGADRPAFYVEPGRHDCQRCGDTNYDRDRVCLTCTYPNAPTSLAFTNAEPREDRP